MVVTFNNGDMIKMTNGLPELMRVLGGIFEISKWCYAEIMNCVTGELIATWRNDTEIGVTTL